MTNQNNAAIYGEQLDAAIDAAIAAQQQGEA